MTGWLDNLANRTRRIAIPDLMNYIVGGMLAVFVADLVYDGLASQYLLFDRAAVFGGEAWRVLSFVLLPPASGPLFVFFALYFYWMIGQALEGEWGASKFNWFYLIGVFGTMAAGLVTGFATNFYLNLSLFFAFAILFPDFEIRLFFVLPVKVKWLAWLDAAFFALSLIVSDWPGRVALLVSVANVALFFWTDARTLIVNARRRRQWKNQFRK